jgi:hypothetical protein
MKQKPLFSVKPKFIPKVVMMQSLFYGFFGALFLTVIGGLLLSLLTMMLGFLGKIAIGKIFWGCFLLGIIGIPILYYEIRRKNAAATRFDFFEDRLSFSYFSGRFLNRKQGRLYYRDIVDVVQNTSFLQGLGNLKTIELHAPASAYYEPGQKFVGIAIEDVPMGTGIAEKILEALDKVHAEYRDAWAANMQRSALAEARAAEDAASPAEEEVEEAEASEDTADLLRAQPVIPPSSVPSRDTQEDAALESAGENEPEDNAEEEPQELEPAISDERPHHSGKDK